MTITIRLSTDEETQLAERAAALGCDVAGYVHRLIGQDVGRRASADEALAPFRQQVEESGLTDDELGQFFEEVREEVWQEKQAKPSTGP